MAEGGGLWGVNQRSGQHEDKGPRTGGKECYVEKEKRQFPGVRQCPSQTGATFVFQLKYRGFVLKNKKDKKEARSFLANRKKAGDMR